MITFLSIASTLIVSLAYTLRIFEKPYYTFNLSDPDRQFYPFHYLSSSVYYTVITMSSVGYGDIIACSSIGRLIVTVIVVVGAFLLSLMVTLTTSWLNMDEQSIEAVDSIKRDRLAISVIRHALQYNVALKKRQRLKSSGNED